MWLGLTKRSLDMSKKEEEQGEFSRSLMREEKQNVHCICIHGHRGLLFGKFIPTSGNGVVSQR